MDRKTDISRELCQLFEELSGIAIPEGQTASGFLDMGFDSLFLTQAGQLIKRRFGVAITFRQLMGELDSIDRIAAHLAETLEPDDAKPVEATPSPVSGLEKSVIPASPEKPDEWSRLIARQLAVMEKQAELMRRMVPGGGDGRSVVRTPESSKQVAAAPPTSPLPKSRSKPADDAGQAHGPFRKMSLGPQGPLTNEQETYLKRLIGVYCAKTSGSKAYAAQHRPTFCDPRAAGGFNPLWKEMVYPIVCERSKGSAIWDIDGNEYVDVTLGFGVHFLGHSPDFITEALSRQIGLGTEIGPQAKLAGETAALVCELTGMDRATFCTTGSEAVMAAMRVARTVTAKDKVVIFTGDYHGMFDSVLVKGIRVKDQPKAVPIAPGIPPSQVEEIIVLNYGDADSLEVIRGRADEIAAVIVEPVQARHPDLQPREFLHALRKLTEENEIALVFDEIITGFRCHQGGAQAYFGIRADMATYGKIVGGGMPIGVLTGRSRWMDTLDGGQWSYGDESIPEVGVTFFAGTFVRHPLTIAAARAALTFIKEQGPCLQEKLNAKTGKLVAELNRFFEERSLPVRLQHFSSLFYYDFHPDLKHAGLLFYAMRNKGIHIWEGRVGFLSIAHSDEDIERVKRAFIEATTELAEAGFFPTPDKKVIEEPTAGLRIASTDVQRGVWLSSQFDKQGSCAFNEVTSLTITGEVDHDVLKQAIAMLPGRHDALRTVFEDDGRHMLVKESMPLPVEMVDLSRLAPQAVESRLDADVAQEADIEFDLRNGPLMRAKVYRHPDATTTILFCGHHVICDGWSFGVLADDLSKVYVSLRQGGRIPDLPSQQFSEFAVERMGRIDRGEFRADEDHWFKMLEGAPKHLALPTDRPMPKIQSFRGGTYRRFVGKETAAAFRSFAAKQKCTMFGGLLSVFNLVLHRITGQDDICIGVPTADQANTGHYDLFGLCVNLFPFRSRISDSTTFSEFVSGTGKALVDAQDHTAFSFNEVIKRVVPHYAPGQRPLIDVCFNVERLSNFSPIPGCRMDLDPRPKRYVIDTLFVNVVDSPDGLKIDCDFNGDLMDVETVARWIDHFVTVIGKAAGQAECSVRELPIMSEALVTEVLREWNETKTDYPSEKSLAQLFVERASSCGDSVAIVWGEGTMTYAELDARSNAFAAGLVARGVACGERVGVSTVRSPDVIAGILGILKAGCSYVPLDHAYPDNRMEKLVELCGLRHVVCEESLADRFARLSMKVHSYGRLAESSGSAAVEHAFDNGGVDPAYVMFTSGSSGEPKGVEVSNRSVARLVLGVDYAKLDDDETFLLLAPMNFDASTFELWAPLLNGGRLVLAPDGVLSLDEIGQTIKRHEVTTLWLTAGLFHQMVDLNVGALRPLRQMIAGGDSLSPRHVRDLRKACPSLRIINGYGPTECTTFACCHTVAEEGCTLDFVPIGRPIGNTRVYVMDAHGQVLPPGIEGELCIAGDGLAKGYVGDEALTSRKFEQREIGGRTERIYRTGDLARWRNEGVLEFRGRLDNQVKINGFRIELEEIESNLELHAGVAQCVVNPVLQPSGEKTLVGYVVRRNGEVDPLDLARHVRERMPEFMVPKAFVSLPDLPLSANGKVDRDALPAPKANDLYRFSREPAVAENDQQAAVIHVWSEILNCESPALEDHFTQSGGTSMQAIRLLGRISQETGEVVSVAWFVGNPRLGDLMRRFADSEEEAPRSTQVVVERRTFPLQVETPLEFICPINSRGGEQPIFFFPGGYGGDEEFLVYAEISRNLGTDRPFYGLKANGMARRRDRHTTVEQMVDDYLVEIVRVQPHGPYHLVGECVGAGLALAMASKMRERGMKVGVLMLLDPYYPDRRNHGRFRRALFWDALYLHTVGRCQHHWRKLMERHFTKWPEYVLERLRDRMGLGGNDGSATGMDRAEPFISEEILEARKHNFYRKTIYKHEPKAFWGDATIISSREMRAIMGACEWGHYIKGEVTIEGVDGTHLSYIREHVGETAATMRRVIEERETALAQRPSGAQVSTG